MNREQALKARSFRQFRRTWIPIFRTLLSSSADIVGDWVFYFRILESDYAPDLAPWLLSFSIVASFMGAFTLISIIMNNLKMCINIDNIHKRRFQNIVSFFLIGEMFIEDIPQFILSSIAMSRRNGGDLTGYAVFNITTSSFNFIFNILDLMSPLDEEHFDEIEEINVEEGDEFKDN
jgi:hypothetical protein